MNKTITVDPQSSTVTIEQTSQPETAPVSVMGNSIQTGYGWWFDVLLISIFLLAAYAFKKCIDRGFRIMRTKHRRRTRKNGW
jgi:hypothetical protein